MTTTLTKSPAGVKISTGGKYRVMVVDDSAVIRGFIARWLQEDPEITVVNTSGNGLMALRNLKSSGAEVVILDIEMPVMDGLTALPKMIAEVPDIQILVASTLTRRNAEISLKALSQGAADYVPKPETNRDTGNNTDFRRDLISKVKALAATRRNERGEGLPEGELRQPSAAQTIGTPTVVSGKTSAIQLRKASSRKPEILAIGSSTGGPQALVSFLSDIKDVLDLPVVITQHMPATFTAILAEHLARATGRECAEAKDGEVLTAGRMYVAPGGYHMTVVRDGGSLKLKLDQGPQENFCRPSVDPMFRSVSKNFEDKALCVILTGMGHDGLAGSKTIIEAGGTLIAQDEKSSVVWGMPGAVATAGLCSSVLPLDKMGAAAKKLITGARL